MSAKRNANQPYLFNDFRVAADRLMAALARLEPYILLSGESGCGKTTLLRYVQSKLDNKTYSVVYLCHGGVSSSPLAHVLADTLHLPTGRTRAETSRLLLSTLRNLPAKLLLWLDEAQLIHADTLHELRLLAEADLNGPPLFCVLLCGLPQFRERLMAPNLSPLYRRISVRIKLRGLLHEEIAPFVDHVLGKNTANRFSPEALSVIFEQARAVPAVVKAYAAACLDCIGSTKGQITKQTTIEVLDLTDAI